MVTELFRRNLINGRLNLLATSVALWLSGAAIAGVETSTNANDVILASHDGVAFFTEGKTCTLDGGSTT